MKLKHLSAKRLVLVHLSPENRKGLHTDLHPIGQLDTWNFITSKHVGP